MLIKLLKYELKWNYKILAIFYTLALIAEMLGEILLSISNLVGVICMYFMLEMLACALIIGTVRLLIRFIKTTYHDEAYLTHTLPIDKKTILTSKTLSAVITTITTFIITIICLYRICTNVEIMNNYIIDMDEILKIFMIIFLIHLQAILITLVGYMSIIIGHRQGKNKSANSLLIGIIIYIIMSVILGIISNAIGIFWGVEDLSTFDNDLEINWFIAKLILTALIYALFGLMFYKKSKEELEKGIDID